jgi:ribosome biogenesis GTPase / thiamine phosphate phosphatase
MNHTALGWSSFFESQLAAGSDRNLRPARVIAQHRGLHRLSDGAAEVDAEIRGRLRGAREDEDRRDLPVTGDWVLASGFEQARGGLGRARIERVLERQNQLVRGRSGRTSRSQVLAANVDAAWIVMGIDADFNPRRLERFLSVVRESGIAPVVILNKLDLEIEDRAARVEACRSIALEAPIYAISAETRDGVEALIDAALAPGSTFVLLGSSGVGKSTLVNALLGEARQRTGRVRAHDGRGCHTTTERELIELPNGALLIDSPGLRLVQLWASEEGGASGVDVSFADLAELASGCRFRDCTHEHEPGCAVRSAIVEGRLDPERLDSHRALARELAYLERRQDARARAEAKRAVRILERALRRSPKHH